MEERCGIVFLCPCACLVLNRHSCQAATLLLWPVIVIVCFVVVRKGVRSEGEGFRPAQETPKWDWLESQDLSDSQRRQQLGPAQPQSIHLTAYNNTWALCRQKLPAVSEATSNTTPYGVACQS